MASQLQITVNGKRYRVEAAPDTPLLYVLRNELNLNGPKFGCGLAQSGAWRGPEEGGAVTTATISRRRFLTGGGALIVTFSLPLELGAQTSTPPERLAQYAWIDSWLAVGGDGRVTVFTGKVELGTGVETALSQIVAEELDVPVARLAILQGDTARTPDQGYTVGSKTIAQGRPRVRPAAAEAREA